MLAFGHHNLGLYWGKDPETGPSPVSGLSAQFWGLLPSFGAFGPVSKPLVPPQGGKADIQTDKHYINIYEYDVYINIWTGSLGSNWGLCKNKEQT